MSKLKDEIGNRYAHLVVIGRAENTKGGNAQWLCKCDCGNTCVVNGNNLRRGKQVSCGCYGRQVRKKNDAPAEMTKERLYRIWQRMNYRCYNEHSNRFSTYGGRGITVCDEWRNDYIAFRTWAMQNGYCEELTLDRIDNDVGYEPQNCRWASVKDQQRNRRNNRMITLNGETKCVSEWCEQFGLKPSTVSMRLHYGWTVAEEILFGKKKKGVNYG